MSLGIYKPTLLTEESFGKPQGILRQNSQHLSHKLYVGQTLPQAVSAEHKTDPWFHAH